MGAGGTAEAVSWQRQLPDGDPPPLRHASPAPPAVNRLREPRTYRKEFVMSEVQVTKGQSNPRREASEIIRFGEGSFPFSRLLDISPFGLMREFTNEMDRVFHGWGDG